MKKLLSLAAFGAVLASAVLAQSVVAPQVPTVNPTADRVQVIPNGQPSAQSVYASPAELRAINQYVKATLTAGSTATGYTNTFGNYQTRLSFDAGATMSYAYITFAPNPSDGTEACYFSTGAITTLYLSANTGQTLNDAATTLAANTKQCYLYSRSNLTWDRTN